LNTLWFWIRKLENIEKESKND
jgi:hypothetical protein